MKLKAQTTVLKPLYCFPMPKLVFLFLLFPFVAFSQTGISPVKSNIVNTKTAKHINIPGTRLYIISPKNFTVAKTFIGLEKQDAGVLNIYDLVGGNFYTNDSGFNSQSFEKLGAKVFDYREIKVNGYPAKYIYMQGQPTQKAYALVFGDTTFSVMIMALYRPGDEETGKDIANAFNTIYYDKETKIDPFATANFSVDSTSSKFRFWQYAANMYQYAPAGVNPKKDSNYAVTMIMQTPKETSATAESMAFLVISKSLQHGFVLDDIKNATTKKVNGVETYEAEVYGKTNGKPTVLYFYVLANGDSAIVITGVATKDFNNDIVEFKKFAGSVKLK